MAFTDRVEFTKEMKKEGYTILAPNMAPIHFRLFENLFASYGYNVEILQTRGRQIVDEGLKYVHNDTCYPALLTIGQMMDALHSGKYDLHKTALIITQTGGGCRASNYIHLLRKALEKDGLSYIPVISLNMSGLEKNSGFKLTLPMIRKALGVKFNIEMLWLPDEMFSQKGRHFRIVVGDPIPVAELQRFGSLHEQALEVLKKAYFLEKTLAGPNQNR